MSKKLFKLVFMVLAALLLSFFAESNRYVKADSNTGQSKITIEISEVAVEKEENHPLEESEKIPQKSTQERLPQTGQTANRSGLIGMVLIIVGSTCLLRVERGGKND